MRKTLLLLFLLGFGTNVVAHQDKIIHVSKRGDLTGLPEEYLPANIDLDKMVISIEKNVFTLPICVSKYFKDHNDYKLLVTSSWYHQRSTLPPYINFRIIPEGKDFEYSLLFGLGNLKVIELQVLTHPNKNTTLYHKIEINNHCRKAISESYASN